MTHHKRFWTLALSAFFALVACTLGPVGSLRLALADGARLSAASNAGSRPHAVNLRSNPVPPGLRGNLHYNGGPVEHTSVSYAIFWEPPTLQDGSPTQVSPTYHSLIERYFQDVGGSGLYNNNTQYTAQDSGPILNSSSLGGVYVDTAPYPASTCVVAATPSGCIVDAAIQAEVVKVMGITGWQGGVGANFFVYLSSGEGGCVDSSSTSCFLTVYCAYHSRFTYNGQEIIYSEQPYGYFGSGRSWCSPGYAPNHDVAADTEINFTSHEQMEMVTDPTFYAWFNSHQLEIGDLCGWNFGPMNLDGGQANQAWGPNHDHFYAVQQEWSNAQHDCVQTGP